MDTLWAPWRAAYIKRIGTKQKGCLFCRILSSTKDKQNYIFLRRKYAYAVLNVYPYSNGHCLVLPNRHVNDIDKLSQEEMADMMGVVVETKKLLAHVLKPEGFNIGMNLGRLAGAGIPGHLHMHIVPRWKGDHNFMPITAGARVISQSLDTTYTLLCARAKTLKNSK